MASELADRGETALRAVDQLLRDRPVKDGPDFSAAIMALSTLRDTLIARHRAGAPALEPLGRLNGGWARCLGRISRRHATRSRGW
ncbi:MAG: hypothetical protein J0H19_02925 [Rhodospirillales bacterium]|nr:hypothetical protein [Rhodospirillales bacterium]